MATIGTVFVVYVILTALSIAKRRDDDIENIIMMRQIAQSLLLFLILFLCDCVG